MDLVAKVNEGYRGISQLTSVQGRSSDEREETGEGRQVRHRLDHLGWGEGTLANREP